MGKLLLVMALGTVLAASSKDAFGPAWKQFSDDVDTLLEAQGVVGGAVWFFHEGEAIGIDLYGMADVEQGRAVTENTIFHWASITKTFTGIAIMQLRDRGLLSLEDPLVDYLPELRTVHNPFGEMEAITIRHVMTHSAGFRASSWPWGGGEPWHPFEPTEWSQLEAMFPYTQIHFAPGSRYGYSNPAILFLGRIIEIVSGDPYQSYVDKNIFKPLGMHQSYFDSTPPHLIGDRSNNYTVEDGTPKANGLDFDTGITVSNSGLNAPMGDMGRYAAFLMGGDASYDRVLARASLEEMFEPRLPMTDPVARDDSSSEQHIGLTFFVTERDGQRLVGHTGSQQAFRALLYVDPKARVGAIAAFNADGVERNGVKTPDAERVLAMVREQLFRDVFPVFH